MPELTIRKLKSILLLVDRPCPSLFPILRSQQQGEILALLLGDPDLKLSLTETAARVGAPQCSVYCEIQRAEQVGITGALTAITSTVGVAREPAVTLTGPSQDTPCQGRWSRNAPLSRSSHRYGLQPTAMNPRTAVKNVSVSPARSSTAHQAATSSAVTWSACTARSIVPRLSCW
jgi:hypothetical protein